MDDYLTIALILIAVGAVLLGAEVLVPTGGFLVVGALLFFALGVGTILYYGDTLEATVALAGLAVGLPASGFVAVAAWRRMSIGNALDVAAGGDLASVSQLAGLEALKGRVGQTVTPMRPSGTVEFEGRRVDAMTEGIALDAGAWVRCVEAKGGRVIVRQLNTPQDVADIRPADGPAPPPRDPLDDFDLGLDLK